MNKFLKLGIVLLMTVVLTACGQRVEVSPGEVGKILGATGYKEGVIGVSKFRLPTCWPGEQCDRLVTLNVGDTSKVETVEVFMPQDKLTLTVMVQTNLAIMDTKKVDPLFSRLSAVAQSDYLSVIDRNAIYNMYVKNLIVNETSEYLSKYTIAEVASSREKVNIDIRDRLIKRIGENTPFSVRMAGVTEIRYPQIITEAQENAARRREEVAQEEAKLEVNRVTLERELNEAQLQRRIDVEKAEAEAQVDRIRAQAATAANITLRKLDNEAAWIAAWKHGGARVPETVVGHEPNALYLGTHSSPSK